jgi:hypothetical protein
MARVRHDAAVSSPVSWGAYGGEFLERMMAVFLSIEHPGTIRRKPDRGDGGIDCLVPCEDGYEVIQVKGFAARLGAKERRQVKESWDTFRLNPRLQKPIKGWYLAVPVDPTEGEQHWLEDLVNGAPWPAGGRWLPYWDRLAADHPTVVDYFVHGGRQRLLDRQRSLLDAIREGPLTAADVAASLEVTARTLTRDDPFYRYLFRTTVREPTLEELSEYALSQTRRLDDGGFVTISVEPKYPEALEDAPITGQFTFQVEPSSEAEQAMQAFVDFGRPIDLPAASGFVDAPGGLGGEFEGGRVRIGPALNVPAPAPLRLLGVDEAGDVVSELVMHASTPATQGVAGGFELTLHDERRVLTVRISVTPPGPSRSATLHFHLGEWHGVPVVEIIDTVRAVATWRPGLELQLRPRYGPDVLGTCTFSDDDPALISEYALAHLEDLVTLQQFTSWPIPTPEEIDPDLAPELHHYMSIVRGQPVTGRWTEVRGTLKPGVTAEEVERDLQGAGQAAHTNDVSLTLHDVVIPIGTFTVVYARARLDRVGTKHLRFVPDGDDRYYAGLGTAEEVGPLASAYFASTGDA